MGKEMRWEEWTFEMNSKVQLRKERKKEMTVNEITKNTKEEEKCYKKRENEHFKTTGKTGEKWDDIQWNIQK